MDLRRRDLIGMAAAAAVAGAAAACRSGSRPEAPGRTHPASPVAASPPAAPGHGSVSGPAAPGSAASGGPADARPRGEVAHGPRGRGAVALTFHGAGDPSLARRLLADVAAAGAHVTVLAVGSWLDARPEMARLVLDGGHELGNHTQNHLDITAMSPRAAYAEIAGCAARLRRLTGSIGAWFRPSQTRHATSVIRAQAARAGYPACLSYDVDSLDHRDPGPAAVARTVLDGVRGGSIVSLHLGHPGTVTAMPAILDGLRARGLRAVTVSALLAR